MKTLPQGPKIFLGIILAILQSAQAGHLQAAPAPDPSLKVPSGCLLQTPPDLSSWSINFTYPTGDEKKAGAQPAVLPAFLTERLNSRPKRTFTTKTNSITHEAIVDLRGRSTDKWYLGPVQYTKSEGNPIWYQSQINLVTPQGDPNYTPLPPTGFRGLDAVTADTYRGTVSYAGRNCLVFALDRSKIEANAASVAEAKEIALIDAESRLPVEVRHEGAIAVYHMMDPPASVQKLPSDLETQITEGKKGIERLIKRPPRPY